MRGNEQAFAVKQLVVKVLRWLADLAWESVFKRTEHHLSGSGIMAPCLGRPPANHRGQKHAVVQVQSLAKMCVLSSD